MEFGEIPTSEAAGAILAHSTRAGGRRLKKGHRISDADIATLSEAGIDRVIAAVLDPEDVHEDEAAARIAAAICGANLSASAAFTGRVNLIAETAGVVCVDRDVLDRLNLVHEAVTVATVAPFEVVEARQLVATVKIIPFAAPEPALAACETIAAEATPLVTIAPFSSKRAALIQTTLPGLKESVLDKTVEILTARLERLGGELIGERRTAHEAAALSQAIAEAVDDEADLILIAGASAITDRRDVIPAAIERIGGAVEHFGMPVDPGNLLLLGRLGARPVLGLPGCVRSPKLNGFDWVLQRLCADIAVTPEDIMRMGAGGLLKEIETRPLPRAKATEKGRTSGPSAPKIAALVLAAGRSTRMGGTNKLLAEIGGKAMLRRVAEAAVASRAEPVVCVLGHEAARVRAALGGVNVRIVENPDYAEGLSTSLRAGLAALPEDAAGVVVCLGDMPWLAAADIDRLIAAFNPVEGRAICVPVHEGKRGNPVLFARRFFTEMARASGDSGARRLLIDHDELVCEVAMTSDAVLVDIDTPDALEKLTA